MAVTLLTPQVSSRAGTVITFVTPSLDGIEFSNVSRRGMLLVRNDSASEVTLTLDITKTLDGMTLADRVFTIDAGETQVIGPFPDLYNQSDRFVRADFSANTDIGVALIVPGSLAS